MIEVAQFLERFFKHTVHQVELRALPSRTRCFTRKLTEADQFLAAHAYENVYFGIATREGGGDKAHCREVPALWADVDFKTTPEPRAREFLESFPVRPSLIVASGGGWHLYWLLEPPADVNDPRIEPILRSLVRELGGDRAAAEFAHIMRLPGTLNRKYSPPRPCRVLEAEWERHYAITDFDRFAVEELPRELASSTTSARIPQGQRNSSLTSLEGTMRRCGMTEGAIREALRVENRERCDPPLPEDEVAGIARSVAGRYDPAPQAARPPERGPSGTVLRVVSAGDFLGMEIKPREMLLNPVLPEKGLVMIHGRRGVGKTHIALGIAVAVAGGGGFLRWTAPRPRRVLYVDGELPSALLQQWLAETVCAVGLDAVSENLRVITPDLQKSGIPDLATLGGQAALNGHVAWADLIVLDNLSSLVRSGKENEAEGWLPVQEWTLSLRRAGKSVLFVHHSGRNLNARGTSKREDLLDTKIALRVPADYNPSQGLRAQFHFEKARHFHGGDAEPFEVSLVSDPSGVPQWGMVALKQGEYDRAAELFAEGCDIPAVMAELGVSRATAFRLQRDFRKRQSRSQV